MTLAGPFLVATPRSHHAGKRHGRRTTGDAQGQQAHVHTKTTLTVIFLGSTRRPSEGWARTEGFRPEAWPHVPHAEVTSGQLRSITDSSANRTVIGAGARMRSTTSHPSW